MKKIRTCILGVSLSLIALPSLVSAMPREIYAQESAQVNAQPQGRSPALTEYDELPWPGPMCPAGYEQVSDAPNYGNDWTEYVWNYNRVRHEPSLGSCVQYGIKIVLPNGDRYTQYYHSLFCSGGIDGYTFSYTWNGQTNCKGGDIRLEDEELLQQLQGQCEYKEFSSPPVALTDQPGECPNANSACGTLSDDVIHNMRDKQANSMPWFKVKATCCRNKNTDKGIRGIIEAVNVLDKAE